jgi:cell wall-associated NlpC family hydrolase
VRLVDPLDRRFRGTFTLRRGERRTIAVVNTLPVEDWVAGAAGGDAPSGWLTGPAASMDVAAIVARSRAAHAVAGRRPGWDLTSDDILYLGVDGERQVTLDAAARTARQVVAAGGSPIDARIPFVPTPGDGISPEPGSPLPVAAAPARPIPGAPPGLGGRAAALAQSRLGTPYRWGGAAPGGFDCSGLVYWVFGQLGVPLPRVAEQQGRVGVPVAAPDLLPGDVVFFADSSGYVHHEGVYIGGGRMIHAPQTGDVVRVERIDTGYYARQYAGARRFSPQA